MKKDITHRIAFYTGKVAQYGAVHPSKARPAAHKYRQERLRAYKKRMHELIVEGGYGR
jgi:hypothetical protein